MTDLERRLSDHLGGAAAGTRLTFTVDDIVGGVEHAERPSPAKGRLVFAVAACVVALAGFVLVTSGSGSELDAVTQGSTVGPFDPADEVVIRAVEPNPSSDSYVWTAAFGIDGIDPLDSINIGRMGPAEIASFGVDDAGELVCRGTVWMRSIVCDEGVGPKPVQFDGDGRDTGAWVWTDLPGGTAVVQFTDQDGEVRWQRPLDGTALFADTSDNDGGQKCACSFLAIDDDGTVIARHEIE